MTSLAKLSLILAALVVQPGCRATKPEDRVQSATDDMPGYRFSYPNDLPEKCYHTSMNGSRIENETRRVYEAAHQEGWRECFSYYRLGRVNLAEPAAELTSTDWSESQAVRGRGHRDGFEECRRLLLANGNH